MNTREKTEITSVELAYRFIQDEVRAFVELREWDIAGAIYKVFPKSVFSSWWRELNGIADKHGNFPPRLISNAATDAVFFLRDHLLQTTGQRIWGLTFTLYPDGKFNIEYDYNKPADYEEDEETTTAEEATPVANLLGGLLDVSGPSGMADHADQTAETQQLSTALKWLQQQTAKHSAAWGLGSEANWNLDMNEGWLRWTFADGRVMQAAVQVIGTYNTKNGSFMWGWDHPSVPEPLRRAARRVQALGQELGVERWTTRSVNCTQDEAWQFTALAAQQDGASGAYRGDANGTWVYMSFGELIKQ